MARLTAVDALAPRCAIAATRKVKTTATNAMKIGPGLEPLMKLG